MECLAYGLILCFACAVVVAALCERSNGVTDMDQKTYDGSVVHPFSFKLTTGPHKGERKIVWAENIEEAYEVFSTSKFKNARVATRAMSLDEIGVK